jgi:tetratricopeptide (TPR) repeat protein
MKMMYIKLLVTLIVLIFLESGCDNREADLNIAIQTNTEEAFKEFLRKYPNDSPEADIARYHLVHLICLQPNDSSFQSLASIAMQFSNSLYADSAYAEINQFIIDELDRAYQIVYNVDIKQQSKEVWMQNYDIARGIWENIARYDSTNILAINNLGVMLMAMGKIDEAEMTLEKTTDVHDQNMADIGLEMTINYNHNITWMMILQPKEGKFHGNRYVFQIDESGPTMFYYMQCWPRKLQPEKTAFSIASQHLKFIKNVYRSH